MTSDALKPATRRTVFIQPGFVKTATSTLQRHVFRHHPDIQYLGLPAPTEELEWAARHICQADSVHLEPERLQHAFARALEATPQDKIPLLSYENFALYESKDKGLVAERLKQLFPDARIFFTIRRQEDLVKSWYFTKLRRLIKRKAFVPFDEWYWVEAREPWRSILDDLCYDRTIERYVSLFGPDNVRVFLFEELRQNPDIFARMIGEFLGIDGGKFATLMAGKRENVSMSKGYYAFWRRFNHVLPRKLVRKWSRRMLRQVGPSAQITLSDDIARHLAGLVGTDNAKLARRFGLDLASFGYTVSQESA